MANTPTSPLDATGRAAETAAKKNAKAIQDRKEEISIAAQVEAENLENNVFDPKASDTPIVLDEIVNVGVTAYKKIQISEKYETTLRSTLAFNPQQEKAYVVFGITGTNFLMSPIEKPLGRSFSEALCQGIFSPKIQSSPRTIRTSPLSQNSAV